MKINVKLVKERMKIQQWEPMGVTQTCNLSAWGVSPGGSDIIGHL